MDSPSHSSVIIVEAGIFGISTAKVLAGNGIEDLVILEAFDRIGGRIRKENFGGVSVELEAGWIAGVGGKEFNPVWDLDAKSGLQTCSSACIPTLNLTRFFAILIFLPLDHILFTFSLFSNFISFSLLLIV
ncbi:hypothetical protein QN277_021169 [Acacia crassicarpa]|uniref:Amine oxidase domain-containing protein n=1 Tax=Acacia crassicarpa TaxID=499986 RepID=A0AAE1JLD5_9FABA|nr:hypothetical protein QN277_021169 [Acacia crassicarpa]